MIKKKKTRTLSTEAGTFSRESIRINEVESLKEITVNHFIRRANSYDVTAINTIGLLAEYTILTEIQLEKMLDAVVMNLRNNRIEAINTIEKIAKSWPKMVIEKIVSVRTSSLISQSLISVVVAGLLNFAENNSQQILLSKIATKFPDMLKVEIRNLIDMLSNRDQSTHEKAFIAIEKIAKFLPDILNVEIINSIGRLYNTDRNIRETAAISIEEIAKILPNVVMENVENLIVSKSSKVAATAIKEITKDKDSFIFQQIVNFLVKKLSYNYDNLEKEIVIIFCSEISKNHPSLITKEILNSLVNCLKKGTIDIKISAVISIGEISKVVPSVISNDNVSFLVNKLGDTCCKREVIIAIKKIAVVLPDIIKLEIKNLINTFRVLNDQDTKAKLVLVIKDMAIAVPHLIEEDVIDHLLTDLIDSDITIPEVVDSIIAIDKASLNIVKLKIESLLNVPPDQDKIRSITDISKIAIKIPSLVSNKLINDLVYILNDPNDPNPTIQKIVILTIGEVYRKQNLQVYDKMIDALIYKLSNSDPAIIKAAIITFGIIIKNIDDNNTVQLIITKIREVSQSFQNLNAVILKEVLGCIKEIAISKSFLINQDLGTYLIDLTNNFYDLDVIKAIATIYGLIAKNGDPHDITRETIKAIKSRLSNDNADLRKASVLMIGEIARANIALVEQYNMYNLLCTKLNDRDPNVQKAALYSIEQIIINSPTFLKDVVDLLVNQLIPHDCQIVEEILMTLKNIIKQKESRDITEYLKGLAYKLEYSPHLATPLKKMLEDNSHLKLIDILINEYLDNMELKSLNIIKTITISAPSLIIESEIAPFIKKISNKNIDSRKKIDIAEFIRKIAIDSDQYTNNQLIESLISVLVNMVKDFDNNVKEVAVVSLEEIAQRKPKLITQNNLTQLLGMLNDNNLDTKGSAMMAFTKITIAHHNLITEREISILVSKLNDHEKAIKKAAKKFIIEIAKSIDSSITEVGIDTLLKQLKDTNEDIKRNAIHANLMLSNDCREYKQSDGNTHATLSIDASIYDPNYSKAFAKLADNLQLIGTEVSHNAIFSVNYLMGNIYGKYDNSDNFQATLMIEDKPHIKSQSNIKISINFNALLYKSTISFKGLDFMVDTFRFANEPNIENTQKLLRGFIHLQSIFEGNNMYSIALSFIDIKNQLSKGEIQEAGIQAITTISYMAIPTMLSFTAIPYIGFSYGATMAGFTGYHAINNAYSLCSEYGTIEWQLKSVIAYNELYKFLANSSLQCTYDFSSNAKHYEIKANNIKLEMEKSQIKQHLEAKGEFGNKLYDYIHVPILEKKYNLLNKIISGELTEEQAIILKAKHISMTIGKQYYEHCISVTSSENNDNHYNCYNVEQEILDHVVLGEGGVALTIERL